MNMDGTQQEAPFLSTPSARRATACVHGGRTMLIISIHALREEGDRDFGVSELDYIQFLSTPSARRATWSPCRNRRRDSYFYPRPPRGGRRRHDMADIAASGFLSTPSARRATGQIIHTVDVADISIHALREEGDHGRRQDGGGAGDFYPRPPRGGRPRTTKQPLQPSNFYPRPPRGGRRLICVGKGNPD